MRKEKQSKQLQQSRKKNPPLPTIGKTETKSFSVPGPLRGAVRTTHRQKFCDPAYHRYANFKKVVRLIANQHNVPNSLTPTEVASVGVSVSWVKRQRVDLDNVVKGILDALWSNDRRVLALQAKAQEHTGEESAIITVEVRDG